ncbi:MAG: hypothetical protein ACK4ON_02715, partial [Bacteroidia bacterium]
KVGSFSNAYTQTQCGLNYAISGVKLTQRATWQPGVGQPATISISSIPPCVIPSQGHILRAYVYWIVEGGSTVGSVNLTNPLGVTQNFAGTLIGNISGGKCWSCSNTVHFRADVTSHITGNGNYQISGLPQSTGCNDTDGAVLVIIYRDPSATYQGTMVLHDGIILTTGGSQNHTLTGFTACGPTSNATAFTVTGDLQNNTGGPWNITMNGVTAGVTPNFFNLDIRNVTVTAGQSSSLFGVSTSGDCWSWICAGLYYQTTTCVTCTPSGTIATPGAVSGPTNLCAGQTATYSVGSVTGATSYNWTVPSGWTINSGQGTTSISVTAGSTSGNVCVTASNACGSSSPSCTNVTITTAPSQPGPISGTTSVCSGQTLTYSISAVTGATSYNWTVPAGWTINSGQGTTSISVTTSNSTGNVCVTASNSCGTSPAQCLAITVGSAPATPGAISGTNPVCPNSNNTYSIAAVSGATSYNWTVPSGWTINSGQGTISISTTSGTSGGNICVTASNGCGTSAAQCTNITMNSLSTAPTSATANPSTICVGSSTTLTVNGGSLGTGAQWQWFSGSCGGTAVGTGTSISVSPSTTTTYFVRASGTCNTTSCVSVTVTVDQNPATSNAGPNQSVCGLTTTLAGNTPNIGTGTWTQLSGPGTISFSNINSPTSSATASTFGTYVLQWTINNGTCSTSSTVSITFDEMPIPAAAGNDAAICGLSINLSGNTPNIGSGSWALLSGPGTITFSNASSPTSSATASVYGTYTLSWTFTNGACSNTDNVDITFDEMPNTADAGLDDAVCGLTISLNANTANIGTASWTQLSGPGTLSFSNNSSNVSSVTASTYGTYSASWTIVNGVCSTTDNVMLTFDEMPNAANAGLNDSICGLTTNLGGTQANIGISTWSQLSGSGTTTFTNPNQHNTAINVSTSGIYDYVYTIVNGTCITSDTVTHHFFDAPTPVDAGADTAVCALTLNLNAQNPSLGIGTWTQIAGPVIATIANVNNINSQFDASQYGNYTLVWTVVNGVCTLHDTVNVRFDQTPSVASAGIDTTICRDFYTLEGNIPTVGNGVWTSTITS